MYAEESMENSYILSIRKYFFPFYSVQQVTMLKRNTSVESNVYNLIYILNKWEFSSQ